MKLKDLSPGALFCTSGGTLAIKSEYMTAKDVLCIMLDSGEFAHLDGGEEITEVKVAIFAVTPGAGRFPIPQGMVRTMLAQAEMITAKVEAVCIRAVA